MRVVLPWPDRKLSPNARVHWAVKAAAKKKARRDAAYAAYDAMPSGAREVRQCFAGSKAIGFQVTFYPPDARHRDDDNMVGSLKAARDGIADALGVDDRRFSASYNFAEPCKPGRVEVVLSTLSAQPAAYAGITDSAKEKPDRESAPTLNPDPNRNRLATGGDVG